MGRIPKTSHGNAIYLHDAFVYAVGFSPDDRYAISGGFDNTARVWLWHPDDQIQQTCDNMIRNLNRNEWNANLPDQPYEAICPELTIEPEITSTTYP